MKKSLAIITLLVLFACKSDAKSDIAWSWDIEKSTKESQSKNKPLMIHFTTDWCTWCRRIEADTYPDKRVIEKAKSFIALKVNPEKGSNFSEYARRYQVQGYPTILFLSPEGIVLNRIGGYQGPDDFLKSMEVALKAGNVNEFAKEFANGDYKNSVDLVEIYAQTQQYEKALEVIIALEQQKKIPEDKTEDFYMLAGFASLQLMKLKEAQVYFRTILNASKEQYNDVYNRAYLYYNYALFLAGEKATAQSAIQKIIDASAISKEWHEEFLNFLDWMRSN